MCVFSWGKRCGQEQAREESEGTGGETTCGGGDRAGAGGDERLRFSELPAKRVKVTRKAQTATHFLYLEGGIRCQKIFSEGSVKSFFDPRCWTEQCVSFLEAAHSVETKKQNEDELVSFLFSASTQPHTSSEKCISVLKRKDAGFTPIWQAWQKKMSWVSPFCSTAPPTVKKIHKSKWKYSSRYNCTDIHV